MIEFRESLDLLFLVAFSAFLTFLLVVVFPKIAWKLVRLNWKKFEPVFNILGLGILISICYWNILTFYRLLTRGEMVAVEQNPIIRGVEFTFVVIGFFYVVYLLLKFFKDLGARIRGS